MVLEQGCLEELFLVLFLGGSLVVEIMVMGVEMEGEGDKLMVLIPSSSVLSLEEAQEAVTVGGRKDKLQGKINQEQGSLGWILFLVEATITAVIVLHNPTTTIMVDTTMVTIMVTTMATTMVKTMVEVDSTVEVDTTVEVDSTVDTTVGVDTTVEVDTTSHNSKGASATTD